MNKNIRIVLSLVLPVIVLKIIPFDFAFNHQILLYSLVLVILWWATDIVNKDLASLFLLIVFMFFSSTPVRAIFLFPISGNFILIICAYLISQGIMKSNLADRISVYVLGRFGYSPLRLILLSFILNTALIFLIPQPFPRVIILSSIYTQFMEHRGIDGPAYPVIIFSVFVASTCTSTLFLNGDILLNYSALQFGNINMSWLDWVMYMSLPCLLICFFMFLFFIMTFRKCIFSVKTAIIPTKSPFPPLSIAEKRTLFILMAVLLLWIMEPLHSIHPGWVGLMGAITMGLYKLLELKDLKKINFSLLLFMTAAFSIGGVLEHEGIAQVVFSKLLLYLPDHQGYTYYLFVTLVVSTLHMFLGSAVTTLSVTLPALLSVATIGINPTVVTLIAYVTVSIHYLLPFHHATIMVGAGKNSFTNSHVLKYGLGLTLLVFLFVLFILLPWWKLVGLL